MMKLEEKINYIKGFEKKKIAIKRMRVNQN
jgi:hypothetical protein